MPSRTIHRGNPGLTSVFGSYAQDDEYGSRKSNPMELYDNPVTRVQGPFSLRIFHRSWGIMLIHDSIEAAITLLDFPDMERFIQKITTNEYDIVEIGSIIPNVGKVKKMCQLIREHLPAAAIVVGGHVANMSDLDERIDADQIVKGVGVRWMRQFLFPCAAMLYMIISGNRRQGAVPIRGVRARTVAVCEPGIGGPQWMTRRRY